MTLYSLMMSAKADQIFHVYVTNIYDQNIEIGHGRRKDIVNEDIVEEGIYHLMDKVELWSVAKDGSVVVRLMDKHYRDRAEELYDEEYVKKWDNFNPETRPWKHSIELEDSFSQRLF